jgi:hypothetical protein
VSGGGAEVLRDARGRRVGEHDCYGAPVASLVWADDGRLAEAAVRLPDGSWLTVQPRAAHDPRWGVSDLLRGGDTPLTHCAAIAWDRVDAIPPLAEPARLPPGGGTAVLNLVAALAADQRRAALSYRGPYPTEQLFLALLESFRWIAGDEPPALGQGAEARVPSLGPAAREAPDDPGSGPDLLATFRSGALRWSPAPHTRAFPPGGVYVQARERIEKLAWRGHAYYRADWQGVRRRTTHRVHEARGRVYGSLWALDAALEDHLVLAPDGRVLAAALPPPDAAPRRALAPAVTEGVIAVVVAASAPPLGESIRAVAAGLSLEWAPLTGEIAVLTGGHAEISTRLRRALAARLAGAIGRVDRVRLGFATVAELGLALGDALRARAQAHLAAATPAVQAAAFEEPRTSTGAAAGAREIGAAVEALLEDAGQLRA